MEWGFVLGLGAITLVVIGLVIYFGRKLSGAVQKHGPEGDLAASITPTGTVLTACMMGWWVVCLAARTLAPESSLGSFLGGTDGVIAVIVASIVCFAIAAAILEKLGYPIMKRHGRDS